MKYLVCKKCGWQWSPRTEKLPIVCPKCKSYSWNKDKNNVQAIPKKKLKEIKDGNDK